MPRRSLTKPRPGRIHRPPGVRGGAPRSVSSVRRQQGSSRPAPGSGALLSGRGAAPSAAPTAITASRRPMRCSRPRPSPTSPDGHAAEGHSACPSWSSARAWALSSWGPTTPSSTPAASPPSPPWRPRAVARPAVRRCSALRPRPVLVVLQRVDHRARERRAQERPRRWNRRLRAGGAGSGGISPSSWSRCCPV